MENIEIFINLGFKKVGALQISNNEISLHLFEELPIKNYLYGFISENKIKYIGQSTQSPNKRLTGYISPGPSQNTNIRINRLINQALQNNKCVDIYVFFPQEKVIYKEFEVNISAGLENVLIKDFKPEWNLVGKK
jgi:hypothetical protein